MPVVSHSVTPRTPKSAKRAPQLITSANATSPPATAAPVASAAATPRVQGDAKTLTVAADGSSNFKSVQAAIDSIPSHNTEPVTIHIKPGTYKERVALQKSGTSEKPITFRARDGAGSVVVDSAGKDYAIASEWTNAAKHIRDAQPYRFRAFEYAALRN